LRITSRFALWLLALAPKAATAQDMLDRFGSTSPVGRQFIAWCYEVYENHSHVGIVEESFEVWRGLYKEATNLDDNAKLAVAKFASNMNILRPDAERFLFAVETYMAVLMKLLVAEVSLQKDIVKSPSLRGLLGVDIVDGYRKLAHKITFLRSVFEEDVFDWFLEPTKASKLVYDQAKASLGDIVDALDNLDFKDLRTDLIRGLYHGFFDPDTRKALGEFYTKDEIVDEILDFVGYGMAADKESGDRGILVDPSCGSGTFLIRAIARWGTRIREASSDPSKAARLLKTITDSVIGIDIHPFAVAMARVNYLLAVIELLTPSVVSQLVEVRIPVHWTDSLVIREATVPRIDKGPQYQPIEVEIPALGKFVLPRSQDIDWDNLATTVRKGLDNGWSENRFLEEFPEEVGLVYRDILLDLYRWFSDRQKNGKDGRWISILKNAIIVHQLQGKCMYVVGNPPWVRIHNIDEAIRSRIRKKFAFYKAGWMPNLVKTRGRFKEQYDYCMAFVESGLRFLMTNGKLGFVITSKVMQALYAGSMRKSVLEQTRIIRLKDYSLSKVELFKDATNYPLILVLEKAPPDNNITRVEMVAYGNRKSWQIEQRELPVIKTDHMSPWMIAPPDCIAAFRKMQLMVRETGFVSNRRVGDLHDVIRGVITSANDVFLLKQVRPSATTGVMVGRTEGEEDILIEEELVRPFVRGEDLSESGYAPHGYIIWTHQDKDGEVLKRLPKNAEKYFKSKEKRLVKRDDYRKGMPIWTIFRVSPEKLKDKVAWHELARKMEAVFLPGSYKDETLGKRKLIAIQTVYFIATSDTEYDRGMVALLNSTPARAFISSFAERARGGYFRHISWTVGLIPIPPSFDKLVVKDDQRQNDNTIATMYGLDSKEIEALRDYHDFVYSRPLKQGMSQNE